MGSYFHAANPAVHPMFKAPMKAGPAPKAIGGSVQPRSPAGPRLKTISVKAGKPHTRTIVQQPKGGTPAAPVNPDQALIDAAVRLKYGPQEQALTGQIQQNTRFTSGLSDWYANAMNEIRGLQAQQNVVAQQIQSGLQNYNSQQVLPGNADDAQAAAARNALGSQYAAMFGRDTAANDASMNRIMAAYLTQEGNTRNAANAQRMGLLGQQGQLGQAKADYAQTYGAGLAAAEQKSALDQANLNLKEQVAASANLINQGKLKVAQGALQSLNSNRVAGQRVARTNARTQRANQQETAHQHGIQNALNLDKQAEKAFVDSQKLQQRGKGSNKGNGTYTQSQLNKYDNQWNGAVALAQHLKAAGSYVDKQTKKTMPVTRNVVYSALLKEYKNDPEFASAAADYVFGRGYNQHDLHVLATKGVHPKTLGPAGMKVLKVIANAPGVIKQLNSIGGK